MDSLRLRLAEVRQKARRVLLTQGLSLLAVVVIGSVLAIGFSDWVTHYSDWSLIRFLGQPFDDPAVRLILSLAVVGGAGWIVWRSLVRPLRMPLPDVDLALRVEARHPRLKDSFASAVQFLAAGTDPRIGSPALQQSVIQRTLAQVERLDFLEIIDTRRVRLLAIVAMTLCLFSAAVIGLNRSATFLALQRLAFPWSAPQWPRRTNLQLLTPEFQPIEHDPEDPLRIARGDSLQVYVENSVGRLPNDVRLEYRVAGGKLQLETLRPASMRDSSGNAREVAVGAIQANRGPIEFRAVGGDHDDMPFYQLLAIPAPTAESFQVTVTPPAYSRKPAEKLPEGVGQVEALVGSRVQVQAKLSKPVRWAVIKLKDQKARTVELTPDRKALTAKFVIEQSGTDSWWLDLQDNEGFQNVDVPRFEIRGIADQVPDVLLELPATDLQVTTSAEILVKSNARDDLGLSAMGLVWSDPTLPPGVIEAKERSEGRVQTRPLFDGEGRPQQHAVEHVWHLSELAKKPGDEIVFHVDARDDCDVGPPHVGRSTSRRLTFVSPEQKAAELAERQAGLLDDLERAFKTEDQAHAQTNELRTQLQKAGKLRPEDIDALQRVELSQRQLTRQLTDPNDGLEKLSRDILAELKSNKLDSPETEHRMSQLAGEIRRLAENNLPQIEDELTAARKSALGLDEFEPSGKPQTAPDRKPGTSEKNGEKGKPDKNSKEEKPSPSKAAGARGPLDKVAENQQAVKESLGELLQQLAQWRNERDAARDLTDVITEQDQIRKDSAELGQKTVNKAPGDLTPQEQADLAKLAERQRKQAEKLDQLQTRVEDTAERMEKEEPGSGEPLKDAVQHAREQSIADKMRDAAGALEENQTGRASQAQQDALDQLRQMDDILRNRRESDTETLVKKLKQAEEELQKAEDRQEELMKKREKAEQIADANERAEALKKIAQEEEQLQDDLAKLSRKIQRLQSKDAGDAAERAAERLGKSRQKRQAGQEDEADQDEREALDDLQQARRELAKDREQAEETLAQQQLHRISDQLKALIPRQQELIQETLRLENLRKDKEWTRSQLQALLGLSRTQRQLKEETDQLTETLTAAEVFALALKGAARQMERAAERLSERDTGPLTVRAQEAARKRFEDLVASLKPEKIDTPQKPQDNQPPPGEGQGPQNGPPTDGVPILSQLRMLKTLQIELKERLTEIAQLQEKNGQLTPAEKDELADIAAQQGQIADLARNLTEQAAKMQQPEEEKDESDEKPKQPKK